MKSALPLNYPAQKILIIGGDSQLGSYLNFHLKHLGNEVTITSRRKVSSEHNTSSYYLDLSKQNIQTPKKQFEVAIFCAGITRIDLCEKYPELTKIINVDNTIRVIQELLDLGTHVIFLSSNLVFDGTKQFYYPNDETCPVSNYGNFKLMVENSFDSSSFSVLRLTKVLTKNALFLKRWQKYILSGEKVITYTNHFVSPITPTQVKDAIMQIIKMHIDKKSKINSQCRFQLGANWEVSYFDFALNYFKADSEALNLITGIQDKSISSNKYNSLTTYLP